MWTFSSRFLAGLLSCLLCTGLLHAQAEPLAEIGNAGLWPNAYADSRTEQLIDSASQDLAAGLRDSAEHQLQEALQVIRVNHGLRDHRQIQPLQLLIETLFQQELWNAADDQIDYFQWLNRANYELDFPAYLEGSRALGDLLLRASADPANPQAVRYLVAAKNLNWQTISAIEARLGRDDPLLAPWLYRVVLNHYQQSALIRRRGLTSFNFHSDADALVNGFRLSNNETLQMSFGIGEELLMRIEELLGKTDQQRALIRIQRGDWYWLFARQERARRLYQQAAGLLQQAGVSSDQVSSFFKRATLIPETELLTQLPRSTRDNIDFAAWSPLYPGLRTQTQPGPMGISDNSNFQARLRAVLNGNSGQLEDLQLLDASPASLRFEQFLATQLELLSFRPTAVANSESDNATVILEVSLSQFFDLPGSPAELTASQESRP